MKPEEGISLLISIRSAMKECFIPTLPEDHWSMMDVYSMNEEELRQSVQLYQALGEGINELRENTNIDTIKSIVEVVAGLCKLFVASL